MTDSITRIREALDEQAFTHPGVAIIDKADGRDLLSRLDAAEKDAGRYRRLRAHSFVCTNRDAPSEIHFGIGFKQTRPELLDVAIDAALTHNEGEPHV